MNQRLIEVLQILNYRVLIIYFVPVVAIKFLNHKSKLYKMPKKSLKPGSGRTTGAGSFAAVKAGELKKLGDEMDVIVSIRWARTLNLPHRPIEATTKNIKEYSQATNAVVVKNLEDEKNDE